MAFLVNNYDVAKVAPIEYLPCGAIQPKVGMALTQTDGNLAIATGTTKPTYISMIEAPAALSAGTIIPVFRIQPDMVFETTFSASASSIKLGNKVTLHASNGLQVTATTTNGVAEVVAMDGTASGSTCKVRF